MMLSKSGFNFDKRIHCFIGGYFLNNAEDIRESRIKIYVVLTQPSVE